MKLTVLKSYECLKREGVKTVFALPRGRLEDFDMLHQQKDSRLS